MQWAGIRYEVLTSENAERISRSQLDDINCLLSQLNDEGTVHIDSRYLELVIEKSIVVMAASSIVGRESILGIACLVPIYAITGRSGFITHIVVDKSKRRHGIATGILGCLINEARRLSLRRLDLTSGPSRSAAHSFWRTYGFEQRETNNFRLELT